MSLPRKVKRYWKKQIAKEEANLKILKSTDFQLLYSSYKVAKFLHDKKLYELNEEAEKKAEEYYEQYRPKTKK